MSSPILLLYSPRGINQFYQPRVSKCVTVTVVGLLPPRVPDFEGLSIYLGPKVKLLIALS